jgi:predicted TIM-barrel fold metal-dependent hydrolase
MGRTFFDIHMHAMDLSHPDLLAFINRIDGLGMKMVLGGLAEPFSQDKENNILNLLTVMENEIEDYFILMEYFFKNKDPEFGSSPLIKIGNEEFDSIILTPLIMDFGFKHIKTETFYDMALGKPVEYQSADVLKAIQKYRTSEFQIQSDNEGKAVNRRPGSKPIFEIYRFMGINTRNHTEPNEMEDLLEGRFSDYTGKRDDLFHRMGDNIYAGIKLYPPLGFDPWPEQENEELDKVNFLYSLCQAKQIPITVHCSDGGFITSNRSEEYTNPERWRKALITYPKLKLNLAHFGNQGKTLGVFSKDAWRQTVIELIVSYENVYTDISCLAFNDDFYEQLKKLLDDQSDQDRDKLLNRILFGTDFMINLMWETSYNDYISRFIRSGHIDDELKLKMCSENPGRFLFK